MYGKKIDNLVLLKDNGINVPNFDIFSWKDVVVNNDVNNLKLDIDLKKYKGKYAVRSSSNIEDGELNSFAGQFDTYLNVEKKDLKNKIKLCFKSLYNKNVIDYIESKNIDISNLNMNVIVQDMVDSEYSGVLFTSNPQGIINESVIVVGKGLGCNVVEDKIDTTSYYYNTTDNTYYYEGKYDYIDKCLVEELINISKKIKELLGDYLDIEFAIKDGVIYILQARDITTLDTDNLVILDNSNIVESYPNISLPLTISFVKFVYSGVFKGVSYRLLKNEKELNKHEDVFNNMVSSSNGRLYYKISNWYTIIKFLPFNSKIIPVWQEMLGVKNKTYEKDKVKLSLPLKISTYFNSFKELINAPKNMNMLNKKFNSINDYFYNNFNDDMSISEVKELFEEIKKQVLSIWDITLVNDMYSFIYTGLLKHRLKKKNKDYEQITNDYISGINNIESLKPIKSLVSLAYIKGKVSEEEYKKEFDLYIKLYGDRNLEELKLESKTFRTNPELLENKIEEYRKDKEKLKQLYINFNEEKKTIINNDLITRMIAKRCSIGISNREISRLNRTRIYGMVRSMFIVCSNRLLEQKLIKDKYDIYYLTIEEIFNYEYYDLKKIISKRKNDYVMFKKLPSYSRLIFTNKEFDKYHKNINSNKNIYDENELQGIPCSNGIVEGKVLVVNDINNISNIEDKILVTKMTDPGWVFLLASAKGVISEKGSLLSHTAIISREMKIPSIVGVDKVTEILNNDDIVRMNGSTGKIEIIKRH